MPLNTCDIFCKVIDNYGDIGVCWRLARQLAAESGLAVRLWVDDLAVFARLESRVDRASAAQEVAGVQICCWEDAANAIAADVVIEAFACDPPEAYIAAMAARAEKPVWINLEYLTAEDWAAGSHALPSPHPRLPLVKHFFFPGFTPDTGGLIREAGLIEALRNFQADGAAQAEFWQRTAGCTVAEDALKVSLFAYENAAIPGLLNAWAQGEREVFCAVTAGRHVPQVEAWAASSGLASGRQSSLPEKGSGLKPALQSTLQVGRLTLAFLPFLPQGDYDLLLAACDLNFVRGEDSFVRAQWAGRPFVWHIYQQEEGAHLPKLAAFMNLYCAGMNAQAAHPLREFWQAWEREESADLHWPALHAALSALQAHAEKWAENLVSHTDLASKLLIFCQNLLECRAFPKPDAGSPQR